MPGFPDMDEPARVVMVYRQPGCPYCRLLRRALRRRGIEAAWRNIWDDERASIVVREASGGDETAPAVRLGAGR